MSSRVKNFLTKAGWLLFYLYIVMLCYFLFFSERYGRHDILKEYKSNLVLFREIKRFILYRNQLGFESFVVNILGNIFAFAPFGFLLPLLNKRYRKLIITVFLSFLFSLCIEAIQFVFRVGIFDVDDLFLNTVGGLLGYVCYKIVISIFSRSTAKRVRQRV